MPAEETALLGEDVCVTRQLRDVRRKEVQGPRQRWPPSEGCREPQATSGMRGAQYRWFIVIVVMPSMWPISRRHTRQKQQPL